MQEKEKVIPGRIYNPERTSLLDALDRVIEKGAYVRGEAILSVADVDLIFIGLQLVVSSVSKLESQDPGRHTEKPSAEDLEYIQNLEKQIKSIEKSIPSLLKSEDPHSAEKGIAKLVLTLVELIRQLLEREALRRIEKGNLSDIEIRKLGITFEALDKKIKQLKAVFGIKEDLNIDLGPMKLI